MLDVPCASIQRWTPPTPTSNGSVAAATAPPLRLTSRPIHCLPALTTCPLLHSKPSTTFQGRVTTYLLHLSPFPALSSSHCGRRLTPAFGDPLACPHPSPAMPCAFLTPRASDSTLSSPQFSSKAAAICSKTQATHEQNQPNHPSLAEHTDQHSPPLCNSIPPERRLSIHLHSEPFTDLSRASS